MDKERFRATAFLAYTQSRLDYDKYWSEGNPHQKRWNGRREDASLFRGHNSEALQDAIDYCAETVS